MTARVPRQRVAPGPRTVSASLQITADTVLVSLAGVFDAENASVLDAAVTGAASAGVRVVVDVRAARFADTAAARTFVVASLDSRARTGRLELQGVTAWTAAAFENAARAMARGHPG